MVDDSLVTAARRKIAELAGEAWSRVEAETQDGGTFVFFQAWIQWGEAKEVDSALQRALCGALNTMIPVHPGQDNGSWSINVYYGAALVDAIFPHDL